MSETPYSLAPSPCAFCMCFVIFIFLPTSSVSALYIYIAFKRRESTKTCYLHAFLAYSFFFFCQLWAMPMSKTKRIPQLTSCCIKVVAKKKKKKSINFCVICDLEGFNQGGLLIKSEIIYSGVGVCYSQYWYLFPFQFKGWHAYSIDFSLYYNIWWAGGTFVFVDRGDYCTLVITMKLSILVFYFLISSSIYPS